MKHRNILIDEIPSDWAVKTLDRLVNINTESRDPRKVSPQSNFLYIDIESIGSELGIINSSKEILGKDAPSRARRVVHENDVIMSTVRPYLKAFAIVPKEYENQICSTGFAVLSSKGDLVPKYLLYSLFSNLVIDQCNRMMIGGQYPALNTSQVKKIKIPVPSIPEQRKITEILSTTDYSIQKSDEIIAKTEQLKKGMMQKLLTEGIGHDEFNDTAIGKLPLQWKLTQIGDIADVKGGKRLPKGHKLVDYETDHPYIRVVDFKNMSVDPSGLKYLSNETYLKIKNYRISSEDVYISIAGTIGLTGIIPNNLNDANLTENAAKLTNLRDINNKFLSYVLCSDLVKPQINSSTGKATQPKLALFRIKNIKIPLPPLLEQDKIVKILSLLDIKIQNENKRKHKLQNIKKGLMNDLLTGRKRVQVTS